MPILPFVLALLFPAAPLQTHAPAGQAPAADPKCAGVRVALPRGFDNWSNRQPLGAGAAPRNAPVLAIGRGADLSLHPLAHVQPVAPWGKPPVADTSAGLAMFQLVRPGTYRIALGTPAWIDVVRAGQALPSLAHGHGPACSGIRKIVDFRLQPGRYVIQLSGGGAAVAPILIAEAAAKGGPA